MPKQTLIDEISETIRAVDQLAERQREGMAYAAAQQRLEYLCEQATRLQAELLAFRQALTALAERDSAAAAALQQHVYATLRQSLPAAWESPAHALVEANLDLFQLVEYTGAAIVMLREYRILVQSGVQITAAFPANLPQPPHPEARDEGDSSCERCVG